jgi:hypothetical protein
MLAPQEILISLVVLAVAAFAMPTHARCPSARGWMGNGIRPDGSFQCLHHELVESDAVADAELQGRIYCGATEQPIVVDERSFRCASRAKESP